MSNIDLITEERTANIGKFMMGNEGQIRPNEVNIIEC